MYLSTERFNQAVELKRMGDYSSAIRIYREEIGKMVDAKDYHEFSTYAHAMAKCYYLQRDFYKAKSCYKAILAINVLFYPVLKGFVQQEQQYFDFASGWAPHIGYVLNGWDKDYAGAIAGKGNNYDQNKYFSQGLEFITRTMLDIVLQESNERQNYVKNLFIEELHNII